MGGGGGGGREERGVSVPKKSSNSFCELEVPVSSLPVPDTLPRSPASEAGSSLS